MARTKEFDPEIVLERAMELFWRKGYKNTSLKDLLGHMGISRQSLYDTYGDKHQLYLAAMDHYAKITDNKILALEAPDAGLQAIKDHFNLLLDMVSDPDSPRACMIATSALEVGMADEAACSKVTCQMKRAEDAFYNAVSNAMKRGEIGDSKDPRALARFLTLNALGTGILSRAGTSREEMAMTFEVTLAALG